MSEFNKNAEQKNRAARIIEVSPAGENVTSAMVRTSVKTSIAGLEGDKAGKSDTFTEVGEGPLGQIYIMANTPINAANLVDALRDNNTPGTFSYEVMNEAGMMAKMQGHVSVKDRLEKINDDAYVLEVTPKGDDVDPLDMLAAAHEFVTDHSHLGIAEENNERFLDSNLTTIETGPNEEVFIILGSPFNDVSHAARIVYGMQKEDAGKHAYEVMFADKMKEKMLSPSAPKEPTLAGIDNE